MAIDRHHKQYKRYTDLQYIAGLKEGDPEVIEAFFYSLCAYTLNDIRWSVMMGRVDYDDLVDELYLHLSASNWHKLDTFEGRNNCSFKSWVVKLTWRFFLQERTRLIHDTSSVDYDNLGASAAIDDSLSHEISMDVESTFKRMSNKKYVQVLRWMLIDGYDSEEVAAYLSTSANNVYNIKHRAIVQFVDTFNR